MSSLVTDIWLFYYFADLAAKCLFQPTLRFFWGFDPINVVRYCQDPKMFILGRKHVFWLSPDRSRNATWARAKESKKKKKKEKEKKLRDVTYNVCAQTTYLALPNQSCRVGWGPGRSQPCQVSSKLVKGFGSLTSWGSKSAIFLCLALWLT